MKADHSEGGWRSVSKAQKGKAGRGWGLKDGLLAENPPPTQVFGRLQQDQGPSHGGQVAKFEQAAIGGGGRGSFGADSEQGRDFNLLSAFEQFVEGSQGSGKYGGKPGREEENPKEKNINMADLEKKRKERFEESLSKLVSRRETNGRKDEETEERNVDAGRGGQKQREVSVRERQEGSSEEEMLVQVVDSLKKSISKDANDLQNRSTVNSSASLLAQSGVTPLMGENPVPFLGKSSISEEGNTVSVNRPTGKENGGEVKDKKGDATEFPQTEMGSSSLSSEKDAGGKERTTKSQTEKIDSDLNGVPSAKDPRQQGRSALFKSVYIPSNYSLVGLVWPNTEELISRPFMGL